MANDMEVSTPAENVSEMVEATVSKIEEDAEDAIERAQERVDNAQDMAQSIADAAVFTELGRRVEANERSVEAWQGVVNRELSEMRLALENFQSSLEMMKTELLATLQQPVTGPSSSSQETSSPEAEVIVPQEVPNNQSVAEENPEAKIVRKLRRWI